MTAAEQTTPPRTLTPTELAALVKVFREIRQWSQEQLAAISGLSTRTVQRVEEGQASNLDTRRALARAFDFEDIDALNKPYRFPSEAEQKAAKEKFDRENITLKATQITSGKDLASLVDVSMMDVFVPGFELPRDADEQFAELTDYFREYRDCAELYSEREKFDVYDDMQNRLDALSALGVSLCYATRKVGIKVADGCAPLTTAALYVVACHKGKELTEFAMPRESRIG